MEHEAVLLEPCVGVGHQTGRSVEFGQDVVKWQPFETHIWMDGI